MLVAAYMLSTRRVATLHTIGSENSDMAASALLILLVEDEEPLRAVVASILRDEGYSVAEAADGKQALDLLTDADVDANLVLLDMRMPGMDGWQFAHIAKEHFPDLPVLVMTAARDARDWAREVDAVGFIAKPFDIDELLQAVASNVRRDQPDEARDM